MRHSLSALAAAGVIVLALAGCSGAPKAPASPSAADCTPLAAGDASKAVKVTGGFGTKPSVSIPTPLGTEQTERSVTEKGTGAVATTDDMVELRYTMFNATSGDEVYTTGYDKGSASPARLAPGYLLQPVYDAVNCTPQGSRVVGVTTATAAYGAEGNPSQGVAPDDSLVFVIDVVSVKAAKE